MKTDWDYTSLADAYLKRPDYVSAAVDAVVAVARLNSGDRVCDVGAGVAHLTLMLAAHNLDVVAVEPNDAMRRNGIKRTKGIPKVSWIDGTGEATGQRNQSFNMVTFGSSFNVCDRRNALKETARILKPQGWFACMWNHRRLDDPIQDGIEAIIKDRVVHYGYGVRRQDQTEVIEASGLYGSVVRLEARVVHKQTVEECVEAWRSHATLERQAGAAFGDIVVAIETFLRDTGKRVISVPYSTNVWMAQLR